ncbi:hypothetical protein P3X46_018027 [Hevea brasiliensis]|uniref:Uncharacterized protein n=2 Tax=Hevea brasiliensis TaxID=3981 RepID=A0ABQ9LPH8_HEVBR|nr:uncharacterized protein LOC110646045 [Hevea brasiliensis]KAF2289024.1 hypothetical protein GH714_024193 [Hevea brasiliensis]KAJ9169879.1 hypothetical protein P3X46_018027 [Hevea brasiliensis]
MVPMAASANPSGAGNNQEGASPQKIPSSKATAAANGVPVNSTKSGGSNSGASAAADNSQTEAALRHCPGISTEWTAEEQSLLEDLLNKYTSESMVQRYAKIALQLKDKTVRDVALRCRWMTKKENGKRRKEDHSARKNKDRKEKAADSSAKSSSHLTPRPNGPSYAPPMIPMDNDDGISYKDIGGASGELLEQNAQILSQISANFASFQIHDNLNLLSKTRDNILSILNDLNDMPEIMKQMPSLPVKVNEELANSILPPSSHHIKS